MPNSHTQPTDPPLGVLERPRCKHCQAKMNMAGIAPGLAGYELCTFECFNCHSVQRTLVVTDSLNGEAEKVAQRSAQIAELDAGHLREVRC